MRSLSFILQDIHPKSLAPEERSHQRNNENGEDPWVWPLKSHHWLCSWQFEVAWYGNLMEFGMLMIRRFFVRSPGYGNSRVIFDFGHFGIFGHVCNHKLGHAPQKRKITQGLYWIILEAKLLRKQQLPTSGHIRSILDHDLVLKGWWRRHLPGERRRWSWCILQKWIWKYPLHPWLWLLLSSRNFAAGKVTEIYPRQLRKNREQNKWHPLTNQI